MLRKLQGEQQKWTLYNFGPQPAWHMLLGLTEELGELSHAYLKRTQSIRTNENHHIKILDAVGDIVVYLAGFCNACEIDLQHCVETAWAEVSKRDWKKYPNNGVDK